MWVFYPLVSYWEYFNSENWNITGALGNFDFMRSQIASPSLKLTTELVFHLGCHLTLNTIDLWPMLSINMEYSRRLVIPAWNNCQIYKYILKSIVSNVLSYKNLTALNTQLTSIMFILSWAAEIPNNWVTSRSHMTKVLLVSS